MPFGILIFSGKSKRQIREEIAASQAVPTQVVDDDDSEMTTGDEIVTLDEEATEEIEETVDFDSAQLSDVADFDTELEDVSDEDLFAEDEPPKKKKLK